MNFKTVSI